jgi:hypothetical protein
MMEPQINLLFENAWPRPSVWPFKADKAHAESGNGILKTKNPGSKIAPGLKDGDIHLLMSGKQWAQRGTRPSCQSRCAAFAHSGNYFSVVSKNHFASRSRPPFVIPIYLVGLWVF